MSKPWSRKDSQNLMTAGMLDRGSDQMSLARVGSQSAVQGSVVAFGAATRENRLRADRR
jgi:hypothetical protein